MLKDIIAKNNSAAKVTGRMVLGKTATDLLMERVVKRLPLFSRMFKSAQIKNNELARFGAANAALALQLQFAPDNEKLATVTESMVEQSMTELVLESSAMKSVAKELENLIK
jgi:hypothetical protein